MSLTVANVAAQSEKTKPAHVPALICESILSGTANKAYLRNQEIFSEGDAKQNVYQVESGAVLPPQNHGEWPPTDFRFRIRG
ncbi:MAG: hypothetical protein WBX25_22650 [Rhodomicrobium sp.]